MDRNDLVRCVSCKHLLYLKDAEVSKPGSVNYGIKTEYMCEKCYQKNGDRATEALYRGQLRRKKPFM